MITLVAGVKDQLDSFKKFKGMATYKIKLLGLCHYQLYLNHKPGFNYLLPLFDHSVFPLLKLFYFSLYNLTAALYFWLTHNTNGLMQFLEWEVLEMGPYSKRWHKQTRRFQKSSYLHFEPTHWVTTELVISSQVPSETWDLERIGRYQIGDWSSFGLLPLLHAPSLQHSAEYPLAIWLQSWVHRVFLVSISGTSWNEQRALSPPYWLQTNIGQEREKML